MQTFIKPKVVLWMVFFFVFNLIGCGGGGGGGGTDSSNQAADLQEHFTSFNLAMGWVAEDLPALMETVDQLNTAMEIDDGSPEKTAEIGELVDQFALDAANLVIDVEAMDLAEAGIQEIINPESLNSVGIIAIVGAGLVIKGLYEFGKKMAQKSDDMIEARKNRDKAAGDLMNGVQGADEGFSDAKKEMTDIGGDVVEELVTKVATDLVLSPLNPTSLTGVILKDVAGNKLQDGLKVLSVTKECEDGYDSPGCKIGVSVTDEADSAVVTDGITTIVVGGKEMIREILKEDIPPGSYTEITIDQTPIKDVIDEMIPDGDDDTGDDTGDDDDDDDDDDDVVTPLLSLSSEALSEDETSVTYKVAAAVSGVTGSTTVSIVVENASTGSAKQTISSDVTVIWIVTVQDEDATVTVRRSDTGDEQSLTLSAKTYDYDGTYFGTVVVTVNPEGICIGGDISMEVSGSSISGSGASGTVAGNAVSFAGGDWAFSGTITNNVMSGTWYDTVDPCSGTFSFTKQ